MCVLIHTVFYICVLIRNVILCPHTAPACELRGGRDGQAEMHGWLGTHATIYVSSYCELRGGRDGKAEINGSLRCMHVCMHIYTERKRKREREGERRASYVERERETDRERRAS